MKHRGRNFATSTLAMLFVVMCMSGLTATSMAQTEDESAPPAENKIICYAAQKKWVCAPADQKQKAHDKAMKLVADQPVGLVENSGDDSSVEIKTMDVNTDFNQQVQELPAETTRQPTLIDQQIKDFIPRQDVNEPETNEALAQTVQSTVAESEAEPVVQNSIEPMTQTTEKTVAEQQSTNPSSHAADFNYWHKNYPEKWSFQVIGTSNRHHLNQFLTEHGLLQSDHVIVKTQANAADWWVVLVGLHDSREQALSQRHQLPSVLANQAWVRQIKTIVGEGD